MQERPLLVILKLHGRTRMINQTRRDHGKARVLKTPALPCFNSASASPKGALGQAHWLASLVQGLGSLRYNLYNWAALSAQEAVDAARCMTGWPMALPEGESAQRVAGITLVRQRWEWAKQFAALPILVEHTLISQQKTQND